MANPCGLPAWIVNLKLNYLEPVAVPQDVAEYYYFVYSRGSVPDPEKSFSEIKFPRGALERLEKIHEKDYLRYQATVKKWEASRKTQLSKEFLQLEWEMQSLQPVLDTPLLKFSKPQIRERKHFSLPLPKFICNQFLFADEPVKPPENVLEYYCYYERDWDKNDKRIRVEPFDQAPLSWSSVWTRLSTDKRESAEKKKKALRNAWFHAHEIWVTNLESRGLKGKFATFTELRDKIKMLCPQS